MDPAILEQWNPKKLHVSITKKSSNLNAYIYEGTSRRESTRSLVENNDQITIGQQYSVNPDSGLLIVAFPKDEQEQEFGFDFWVEATLKPPPGEEPTEPV